MSVTPNVTPDARTVLVIDDDSTFRERLVRAFRDRGFDARGATDCATAIAWAEQDSPEYAVVDLRMPDASGLDVVKRLVTIDPATKVVVLTGYGSIATALEAVRLGATHYLTKPADLDDILAALTRDESEEGSVPKIPTEAPSLARVEWEHINRVLVECGSNVSKAARVLGIHRRSLQRKLSKRPVKR
jgi:two-component system response regulator RegA